MAFGTRLAEIMASRNVDQTTLAAAIGITSQAVNQWVVGKTQPVGKRLAEVAQVLDVSVPDLMGPVGSSFKDSDRGEGSPRPPGRPPKKTRLVDQPDQLALLDFWDDLGSDEERMMVFRILKAAASQAKSA